MISSEAAAAAEFQYDESFTGTKQTIEKETRTTLFPIGENDVRNQSKASC